MKIRSLFFALVLAISAGLTPAQVIPEEHARKAGPGLLEKAERGEVLEVLVVVDDDEIELAEKERRRAKGLQANDKELNEQYKRELAALKALVAPQGRIGDAQVIRDSPELPIINMRVPNMRSLQQILSHPKVKAVDDANRRFYPALSQSMPIVGQPSAIKQGKTGAGYRVRVPPIST